MKVDKFLHSFKNNIDTNRKLLISNVVLTILLFVSFYQNLTSTEVVILKANPYCQDLKLGENFINETNQQRLSVLIASSMGNVSPQNAKFQSDTILSYANPSIYQEVKDIIDIEFEALRKERLSINFTPENVFTEHGKTFVSGMNEIIGSTGIKKKHVRTYEFLWQVKNYSPTFNYVNVYDDIPHDSFWQEEKSK